MTRIAFCDDDAALLHQMQDFLEQYRTLRGGVQLELATYTKPVELLADIEAGVRFDVLFLDVLMPGINGINTVREIRRYDMAVQIIFVTSSSEFAVQSYVVGAYYYQLKPIWKDSFFRLTDAVLAECRKRTQHLPPRPAPPHAVSGGLHREWPHRAGAGLHPQRLQRDRGRKGDRLLRERGGKPDLFRLCGPRRQGRGAVHGAGGHLAGAAGLGERPVRAAL